MGSYDVEKLVSAGGPSAQLTFIGTPGVVAALVDAAHPAAADSDARAVAVGLFQGLVAAHRDAVDKALKVTELDSRCAGAWLRAARWSSKLSQPIAGTYAKRAIESDDSMRFDALLKLRPSDRHEAEQLLASWPQK